MKTILRLVTVSAVGVAALAFAGNALATQRLSVTQSATSLTIKATQDASDQQPAKIQIYVPAGYTLNLSGVTPGATVGATTGVVIARDQGGIDLPLTGDVLVDNPANHTKDPCSPGTNAAVLILQLSVAGQTINLNKAVAAQPESTRKLFPSIPWAVAFKHKENVGYVVSAASNIVVKIAVDPASGPCDEQ